MSLFFKMQFASVIFIGWYFMNYMAFSVCLSDDVEFHYGKKRMRNRRRKQKGFWRKFLFLDIRKEVILWHYFMFWVNLIFSFATLIILNVLIYCSNETVRIICMITGGMSFLTSAIILFARWDLYIGNKVRNRKEYRKTELSRHNKLK